jgi:hypothetical protein
MRRLLRRIARALARVFRRERRNGDLTEIEYEAVTLIAYEGRAAYARAREQADYCRKMRSPSGVIFWSKVAAEVEQRTGVRARARH